MAAKTIKVIFTVLLIKTKKTLSAPKMSNQKIRKTYLQIHPVSLSQTSLLLPQYVVKFNPAASDSNL